MAKNKAQKRKAKQKEKLKARRNKHLKMLQKEKADFFFYEADWYRGQGDNERALFYLKKALRSDPNNKEMLEEMAQLGFEMSRLDVQLKGLLGLYNSGQMQDEYRLPLCDLLVRDGQYESAITAAEELLERLPKMKITNKRQIRSIAVQIKEYCQIRPSTLKIYYYDTLTLIFDGKFRGVHSARG